jgi:hypothetical protein
MVVAQGFWTGQSYGVANKPRLAIHPSVVRPAGPLAVGDAALPFMIIRSDEGTSRGCSVVCESQPAHVAVPDPCPMRGSSPVNKGRHRARRQGYELHEYEVRPM